MTVRLSRSCLVYHMPPGLPVLDALDTRQLPAGVPTEARFVHGYCRRAGVPVPTDTWPFYVALGLFRAAAIAAGVHRRAMQGNASAANAAELGACCCEQLTSWQGGSRAPCSLFWRATLSPLEVATSQGTSKPPSWGCSDGVVFRSCSVWVDNRTAGGCALATCSGGGARAAAASPRPDDGRRRRRRQRRWRRRTVPAVCALSAAEGTRGGLRQS